MGNKIQKNEMSHDEHITNRDDYSAKRSSMIQKLK